MINSIEDLQALVRAGFTDWRSEGDVLVSQTGELLLFNYAREAQFSPASEWNVFERISRGLILHRDTGEVIARGFDKFYNALEVETPASALREVTVKFDGSLGLIYHYDGDWRVSTCGSLDSEQARWAQVKLTSYHLDCLDPANTYLVEIVYPANRIVVDYGDFGGLVLIGMRNNLTGQDYFYDEFEPVAGQAGFPITARLARFASLEDAIQDARNLPINEEGYVCRFADGTRLKVKGDAYRQAHKWLTGITPKAIFEVMMNGTIDDIRPVVPDLSKELFEQYVREEAADYADLVARINALYHTAPRDGSRKEFALWVNESHKADAAYLFARHDDKSLMPLLYKQKYGR